MTSSNNKLQRIKSESEGLVDHAYGKYQIIRKPQIFATRTYRESKGESIKGG